MNKIKRIFQNAKTEGKNKGDDENKGFKNKLKYKKKSKINELQSINLISEGMNTVIVNSNVNGKKKSKVDKYASSKVMNTVTKFNKKKLKIKVAESASTFNSNINIKNESQENNIENNEIDNAIKKSKRKKNFQTTDNLHVNTKNNLQDNTNDYVLNVKKKSAKKDSKNSELDINEDIPIKKKKRKVENSGPDEHLSDTPDVQNLENQNVNQKKKVKFQLNQSNEIKTRSIADRNERTIFVGNIPHNVKKKHLEKVFLKFGKVEKIWLRGAVRADAKIPKKVTMMKKLFNEKHPPLIAFVLFSTKQEAENALQMNGTLYKEHHLRVDLANSKVDERSSKDKSVFLGNLPFIIKDDDVWKLFQECGEIESVRIVRDNETGVGKGFGYVNFKSSSAAELALRLDGAKLKDRDIRISRISREKNRKTPLTKTAGFKHKTKMNKKSRNRDEQVPKKKNYFHGKSATDSKKKKPKPNKLELKQKMLAQKLTAKSKNKKSI